MRAWSSGEAAESELWSSSHELGRAIVYDGWSPARKCRLGESTQAGRMSHLHDVALNRNEATSNSP